MYALNICRIQFPMKKIMDSSRPIGAGKCLDIVRHIVCKTSFVDLPRQSDFEGY